MLKKQKLTTSSIQLSVLSVLRIAIGWHFLYEGVVKLYTPNWSSASLLMESKWIFSGLFQWIISNPTVLKIVDLMNIWGLIAIGLGLMLGLFTRLACLSGITLLLLYYVTIPPLVGLHYGFPTEGSYLVVDKTLIEMIALIVISLFPTGTFLGLDRLQLQKGIPKIRSKKQSKVAAAEVGPEDVQAIDKARFNRRDLIKVLGTLPVFGAFVYALLRKIAWESYEEKNLMAANQAGIDGMTTATVKTFQYSSLKDLKGEVPKGQIGDLKVSRLFLGGNLIGGWAHARDLIYVSKLVKTYHSDQKVFDTFQLAETCGINTILTNPQLSRVINAYWRKVGGDIQFISDCGYKDDIITGIKMSVDGGAHACYVQGEMSDRRWRRGNVEEIGDAVDFIRKNGLPAGVGAHHIETIKAVVEQGIEPDFWVKTLHHTKYWSANKEKQHDNIWCVHPEETIAFMEQLSEPWIAFKTLAAGAISPEVGFKYAIENGADFLCVGMYDFQIVEDVNIALNVFETDWSTRKRQWIS